MIQRLMMALLAVIAFAAGYGVRSWTGQTRALPSAPAPGIEFVRAPAGPSAGAAKNPPPRPGSPDRAKLIADIEKVRPQIEAYHKRLDEIAAEFDHELLKILTPSQRILFEARQKRSAEWRANRDAETSGAGPLSDQQIEQLRQQPLWNALYSVAINWRLERMVNDYKLDAPQQPEVLRLLQARREKFLALVDTTPPPSITLSNLASRTQQLRAEPKK
ncbi:MAG: hypothetical protein RIQ93_3280 [Verrucomicrobiota bacterium]|jgi:chromosome segregation ATPase